MAEEKLTLEVGKKYRLTTVYWFMLGLIQNKAIYLGKADFRSKERDVFRKENDDIRDDKEYFILKLHVETSRKDNPHLYTEFYKTRP